MESFSPEFAQYWLAGQGEATDEVRAAGHGEETPSATQRAAFEALVDRVVAARSVL